MLNKVDPLAWLTGMLERMVSGRTKAIELEGVLPGACAPGTDLGRSGAACRPSAHSSSLGFRYRPVLPRHVAGTGGPRSRSIHWRIASKA